MDAAAVAYPELSNESHKAPHPPPPPTIPIPHLEKGSHLEEKQGSSKLQKYLHT